jgi:SAM-dependent methyltransferase
MNELDKQNGSIDLDGWLKQPAGCYIQAWERQLLDQLTADIFGFNAVQIGLPQLNCLAASRMPNKWIANHTVLSDSPYPIALVHDFEELPFESHSLDLVVLPHTLEFVSEPHQLLREVERVLIPEGRLIICGFHEASLWGARQVAGRFFGRYFLPRSGDFISLLRLKDWLKLLNIEIDRGHFGCYAPPVNNQTWLRRFQFMETVGQRWWSVFGAVYVLQAVKRLTGMRLIGPAWKNKKVKVTNTAPAVNRHHRDPEN